MKAGLLAYPANPTENYYVVWLECTNCGLGSRANLNHGIYTEKALEVRVSKGKEWDIVTVCLRCPHCGCLTLTKLK